VCVTAGFVGVYRSEFQFGPLTLTIVKWPCVGNAGAYQ
jgi:hypothetical protein